MSREEIEQEWERQKRIKSHYRNLMEKGIAKYNKGSRIPLMFSKEEKEIIKKAVEAPHNCLTDNLVCDYLWGKLDNEELKKIDEHTKACVYCSDLYNATINLGFGVLKDD